MEEPVLFSADNRLLGSSTGDLSLYGGQSDAGVAIRRAETDGSDLSQPHSLSTAEAGGAIAVPILSLLPGQPVILDDRANAGEPADGPGSFLVTPADESAAPVAPVDLASSDFAAGPSLTVAAIDEAAAQPLGAGAPTPLPAEDAAAAGTVSMAGAVSVALPEAALLSNATGGLAPVGDGLTHALDDAAAGLVAAPLFATGLDFLAGDALSAGGVSPILDAVAGVDTTLGAATDELAGLAGSDPAAGVATLVSLVSVSDMFDLPPLNAPIADASADPGVAMLDALATDALIPEPLLGAQDHEGAIDHLGGLDHHIGL